jgi:competence protein ComFC
MNSGKMHPKLHIWQRVLDLLYPPCCVLCEVKLTNGQSLCHTCDDALPRLRAPFCQFCGEGFPGLIEQDFACPNCAKLKFSFEFARPAMVRDDRTLEMIHRLKYGRELHLAKELGRLASEAIYDPRFTQALLEKWPLVPVPLHHKRLQERHFNQAAEISRSLADCSGLPLVLALKRIRHTEHQTALTRAQRLKNLRGAFVLSRAGQHLRRRGIKGIILVDDVLTTGSTVNECAKALRHSGFQHIIVVTVMRG